MTETRCVIAVVGTTSPQALRADDAEVVELRPENADGLRSLMSSYRDGDIVVLTDVEYLPDGWLSRLRAAAESDTVIATATALGNSAGFLTVPTADAPGLPAGWTFARAVEAIAAKSRKVRPTVPLALAHCVYIRRRVLDLIGVHDDGIETVVDLVTDISQRAKLQGFRNVAADDLFVGIAQLQSEARVSAQMTRRYPELEAEIAAGSAETPLTRSLDAARRALDGTVVAIDGSVLNAEVTGTQLHLLELATALASQPATKVKVVTSGSIHPDATAFLEARANVVTVRDDDLDGLADIAHRPYQIFQPSNLDRLRRLGRRVVVTHQDLMGYGNPLYYPTIADWLNYRTMTSEVLNTVDATVTFSQHVADGLKAEGLGDPARTWVAPIGVNHEFSAMQTKVKEPLGLGGYSGEFVLCIGNDFRHKNRLFALQVLDALIQEHQWPGRMVLAGQHVAHGSSRQDEERYLATRPALGASTVDLGSVEEAEKRWLFGHASVVLYPSTVEGFGLIPFEAADHGVPCLFLRQSALAEPFDTQGAHLRSWDASEAAGLIIRLREDNELRNEMVAEVRAAAQLLSWDQTAKRLLEVYEATLVAPSNAPSSVAESTRGNGLTDLNPDAAAALSAIAKRPTVRRFFFGGMARAYRVAKRVRRI